MTAVRLRGGAANRTKVGAASAAEMAKASRRRGTEAHLAKLAAGKAASSTLPAAPKPAPKATPKPATTRGRTIKGWTPEHRANWLASMARNRAAAAGNVVVDEQDESP
jgi:hypothetical protein